MVDDSGAAAGSRVQATANLSIDIAALNALHLGGRSASDLAYAGRIRPATGDAVVQRSHMLRTDPSRTTPSAPEQLDDA